MIESGKKSSTDLIEVIRENDSLRHENDKLREANRNLADQLSDYMDRLEDVRKNMDPELSKLKKELDYWKSRCCEAEDLLNFCRERDTASLAAENKELKAELEWTNRELQLSQAQLEVVFRIFPDPADRY